MKKLNLKRLMVLIIVIHIYIPAFAAITDYPDEIVNSIRSNKYFTEGLRLQKLANQSFAVGDYDMAVKYAEAAVKAAAVSDVYVRQQVKMYIANNKMSDAFQRLAWADMPEIKRYFPSKFYDAKTYYNLGLIARDARKWDDTINNADKVIQMLAGVAAPPENPQVAEVEESKKLDKDAPLPAQYIVRPWDTYGDCFWNIAGRPWVYGNPHRWPILYQANKKKIPDPNNPDLIEPGMVMDIPSINGEERLGLWDSGTTYSPLKK